jgi:hypothetical protein
VQFVAGRGSELASDRCAVAPFEDLLFLYVRRGSRIEEALLQCTEAQVIARHADGEYSIRMEGRAVAGREVMSHPRRLELLPWVPEDGDPRGLLAIPFWPETLEYIRDPGGPSEERFSGKTPAGIASLPKAQRWRQLSFAGVMPAVAASLAMLWLFIGIFGAEMPLRYVALGVAGTASVFLLGGGRLWYRATAFARWREGRCHAEDAAGLAQGFLAPQAAHRASSQMLLVGMVFLLGTLSWGRSLMAVTFFSTGLWILWPIWWIHLSQDAPEPKED